MKHFDKYSTTWIHAKLGNRRKTTRIILFISPGGKSDTSCVKFALKAYGIKALHSAGISPLNPIWSIDNTRTEKTLFFLILFLAIYLWIIWFFNLCQIAKISPLPHPELTTYSAVPEESRIFNFSQPLIVCPNPFQRSLQLILMS